MENIPAIKDCNGRIITISIEKANSLNIYYSSVFSSEGNIPNRYSARWLEEGHSDSYSQGRWSI